MRVCIIGWYGTETIGDRGILAGIFSLLNQAVGNFSVQLGSLYPYFSERTLREDTPFYKKILGKEVDVKLFDSRVTQQLDAAIATSDFVLVGGGPLMHINAMFMLEYAFKQARKEGKKTILFGCGVGPLHKKRHQKATVEIAENSDRVVLRDSASVEHLRLLFQQFGRKWNEAKVTASIDPSVCCLLDFRKIQPALSQGDIAVNMRAFPEEYSKDHRGKAINENLRGFLQNLSEQFPDRKIRLVPMHYFHIGGDDRDFLNTLALQLNQQNIEVQNRNLSLEQTMDVFHDASLNIGMRFHSVVFQTILSGKNIVLDYTEPRKGKISGFLKDIGGDLFYKSRYFNLQTLPDAGHAAIGLNNPDIFQEFSFNEEAVERKLEIYKTTLRTLA